MAAARQASDSFPEILLEVQLRESGIKQDGQDRQDEKEKALLLHSFSFILTILSILFIAFSHSN
jgi:hypothetical protein